MEFWRKNLRQARDAIDRILEAQRDKCQDCLYWKSDKCSHRSRQADLWPTDNACSDGFVAHFINGQVTMKHGKTQLSKQIQYLTSQSTKDELAETFGLSTSEVEWTIRKILEKRQIRKRAQEKPKHSVGALKEGSIYEQVADHRFAIYQNGKVSYTDTIENQVPYKRVPWLLSTEATDYENTETLWKEVKNCIQAHWDYPNSVAYDILASWTLATYTLEKWKAVPYLFAYGAHETGKTRMLEILASLSFRGWLALYMTPANLYRPIETWKPTVFMDEAETYAEQNEIRALLNGSYRRGQLVPRQVETKEGYKTEFYDCFSMKALAGTKELAQTLQSRCIIFRMSRATRKVNLFIDEEQTQALRNKLLMFRFKELGEKKRKVSILGESIGVAPLTKLGERLGSARLTELFYPIIAMTPNDKIQNNILKYAMEIDKQRWEELTASPEATALTAILQSYEDMKKGKILIGNIADKINENLPTNEWWTNRYTSSICQRLGFRKCMLHGRTAIRWNHQLVERLRDDPRYSACFQTEQEQRPPSSSESSPISKSHLSQKNWLGNIFGEKKE